MSPLLIEDFLSTFSLHFLFLEFIDLLLNFYPNLAKHNCLNCIMGTSQSLVIKTNILNYRLKAIQAHSRWTTGQYSCTTPCWTHSDPLYCSLGLTLGFSCSPLIHIQNAKSEASFVTPIISSDVIYSLSLSIYGKNSTHAMIFKSFLLKIINLVVIHPIWLYHGLKKWI
ncbi:hypothetical protein ACJX0J_019982 [Zea mays]